MDGVEFEVQGSCEGGQPQDVRTIEVCGEAIEEIDPVEFDDDETEISAAVYNRLMMLATASAFTVHQSVINENGPEVWRRLTKRYNPRRR